LFVCECIGLLCLYPRSTSNQSSKPCTVLQYPSRKVHGTPLFVCRAHTNKGVPCTFGRHQVAQERFCSRKMTRCYGTLVDNLSHETDVTSLQDPFTSRPYKTPFYFTIVLRIYTYVYIHLYDGKLALAVTGLSHVPILTRP